LPEYLAPGVFLDTAPSGPAPIEAVPTGTSGFVGVGADRAEAIPITSSEQVVESLGCGASDLLTSALHLFFLNGGERAWVTRVPSLDSRPLAVALESLARMSGIALTAIPECAALDAAAHEAVVRLLLDHAARTRRFAVVDPPLAADVASVLGLRSHLDSSFGALYWPSLRIDGPARDVPASGAICGAYARVDRERGVFRSPANEYVAGVAGLAATARPTEQSILQAAGINVIRSVPGGGIRLGGARTLAAQSDLQYVAVRRYLSMLQCSIARGTGWAICERNDARLWHELRSRIAEFLRWQFLDGALHGSSETEAYFVRCDESTTSVDDRAAGIVVCVVGVALLRPSEFITFRVAQATAPAAT
jgi:phage tail sheath protein FI